MGIALLSCTRGTTSDGGEIERALAAVEMCYHWAGEAGSGDPDRERQVRDGAERDCDQAKMLVAEALRDYPEDPALALGILRLEDIRAFELADTLRARLCARAALAASDSSASAVSMPDHATLCR